MVKKKGKENTEDESTISIVPLKLAEVSLTKKQLEDALKKLEEEKSDRISFIVSEGKLLDVDTRGGFVLNPGEIQCMYGCQEAAVIRASLDKGLANKRSQ